MVSKTLWKFVDRHLNYKRTNSTQTKTLSFFWKFLFQFFTFLLNKKVFVFKKPFESLLTGIWIIEEPAQLRQKTIGFFLFQFLYRFFKNPLKFFDIWIKEEPSELEHKLSKKGILGKLQPKRFKPIWGCYVCIIKLK